MSDFDKKLDLYLGNVKDAFEQHKKLRAALTKKTTITVGGQTVEVLVLCSILMYRPP